MELLAAQHTAHTYTSRRIRTRTPVLLSTRVSTHVLRDYASYHYADRSLESKVRTVSVARTYIYLCARVRIYIYMYRYSVSASYALYRMEFQIQMSEGLNNRRSNFARDNTDFLPRIVSIIYIYILENERETSDRKFERSDRALRFVTLDRNHSSFKGLTVVD